MGGGGADLRCKRVILHYRVAFSSEEGRYEARPLTAGGVAVAGATAEGAGRAAGPEIDLTRTQKLRKPPELFAFIGLWCPGRDSNPHAQRAQVLNLPRMPIPPPGHGIKIILTILALVNLRKVAYNYERIAYGVLRDGNGIRNTLGRGLLLWQIVTYCEPWRL